MNPGGIDRGAGSLLAAAERANRNAPRMLSHALTDLTLDEGQRLSDETRSIWHLLRDNAIDEVERALRAQMGDSADAVDSQARKILDHAGFPDQPDLSAALLEQASNTVLRRNLSARARRAGEADPVRPLANDGSDAGKWATALLLAQSIAEGPEAAPILSAEHHHALVWAVAAALRVAMVPTTSDVRALDAAISDEVRHVLASHDEGRAVDSIAVRLARVAGDSMSAPEALIAGYPELSAALWGRTTGLDRRIIGAIQQESDCARLAIVMKASGVGGEDAARVFVALSDIRSGPSDPADLSSAYGALSEDDAKAALASLRLDPDYLRAVALYSGDGE